VSLNNRISIRDTYGARGGAVDCQLGTLPGSARSGATTEATNDVTLLETEKHQKRSMIYPLAEADMNGRVISESRDLRFTGLSCPEQFPRLQT
jgi:hypothetical protein